MTDNVRSNRWLALRWRKDGGEPVTCIGMRSTRDGSLRQLTPEDVGMLLLRVQEHGGGRARYAIETVELQEVPT